MKLSEYKESGILYAYVLGVLDPERTEQLHEDLETNVALRKELNEIEQSLANFKANFTKNASGKPPSSGKVKSSPTQRGKTQKGQRLVFGILIILVVGLVFLFLSTLYERASYQTQLMESREIILEEQARVDSLNSRIQTLENSFSNWIEGNESQRTFSGSSRYSGLRAIMIPDHTNSRVLIYFNQTPDIPENQSIQLWGRSGNEWRKTGLISWGDIREEKGLNFFILPLGSSLPEMATLESNQSAREPDMSSVLFR